MSEFPTPITVAFDGRTRQRFESVVDDAVVTTITDRARSRLTIETVAEAQALLDVLEGQNLLAFEPNQWPTLYRVRDELLEGLDTRGYAVDDGAVHEQELLADGGQQTCQRCGQPITHTVINGPGSATNACGCAVEPELVADGGQATLDGGDIQHPACWQCEAEATRALSLRGMSMDEIYLCDDCEAPEWKGPGGVEGERRLIPADGEPMTDGGTSRSTIAEQVAGAVRETTKDELDRRAHDRLDDDERAELADWVKNGVEEDVNGRLKMKAVEKHGHDLVPDGGVPQSFEALAATCESCGETVDPDRLIEGECPGCHYRPMADGGLYTVEHNGTEYAVCHMVAYDEDADLEVDYSGEEPVVTNHDEVQKHDEVRLLKVDDLRDHGGLHMAISPQDSLWRDSFEFLEPGDTVRLDEEPVTDGGGVTWTDLTGFQRDCLEAIRRLDTDGEITYGLAIKRELERVYGEEINHGRLYPNLDDLVDADLIEKGELDNRTNSYDLTAEGKAMLEQRARLLADACGMEQPVADGGDSA